MCSFYIVKCNIDFQLFSYSILYYAIGILFLSSYPPRIRQFLGEYCSRSPGGGGGEVGENPPRGWVLAILCSDSSVTFNKYYQFSVEKKPDNIKNIV